MQRTEQLHKEYKIRSKIDQGKNLAKWEERLEITKDGMALLNHRIYNECETGPIGGRGGAI